MKARINRAVEHARKKKIEKALLHPSTLWTMNPNSIDWEQRRYEIAKDVMCAEICSSIIPGIDPNPSLEVLSRRACTAADTLIMALKKEYV